MDLSALFKLSYGMYVVSSHGDGKLNGQIANTVFQVTSDPVRIAVCLNRNNLTHDLVLKSRVFSLTILSRETPMTFIGQFGFKSGREIDKFQNVKYRTGVTGCPVVLDHAVAVLECRVLDNGAETGTHDVIIGSLEDAQVLSPEEPMTYAYYHLVKKGLSPKSAPTYVKIENKQQGGMT